MSGPAPTQRYGDSMDLRGSGTNTQIIMSGSGSTTFAVFTTIDGTNFTMTEITHGLGTGELGKGITLTALTIPFTAKRKVRWSA